MPAVMVSMGGSDSYLHFRDIQAPCLLKLCLTPSNGIVRWWLFPEFGTEMPLDNCTATIILNNPVYWYTAAVLETLERNRDENLYWTKLRDVNLG